MRGGCLRVDDTLSTAYAMWTQNIFLKKLLPQSDAEIVN